MRSPLAVPLWLSPPRSAGIIAGWAYVVRKESRQENESSLWARSAIEPSCHTGRCKKSSASVRSVASPRHPVSLLRSVSVERARGTGEGWRGCGG